MEVKRVNKEPTFGDLKPGDIFQDPADSCDDLFIKVEDFAVCLQDGQPQEFNKTQLVNPKDAYVVIQD